MNENELTKHRDRMAGYPGEGVEKHTDPETGAVWYLKTSAQGAIYAAGYSGNKAKTDFNYRFLSLKNRDTYVANWLDGLKKTAARRAEIKETRTGFKTTLQKGDILYGSWGYDQTNAYWAEVTKVCGDRVIEIRELNSRMATDTSELPLPGDYAGPVERKVVQPGDQVKIKDYLRLHKWSGKPQYVTGYEGGH